MSAQKLAGGPSANFKTVIGFALLIDKSLKEPSILWAKKIDASVERAPKFWRTASPRRPVASRIAG